MNESRPPEGTTVRVRDVRKAFGGMTALEGVSLDLTPGELVALVGPSGCGKSTLLRLLAGLERPTAGVLRVGGEPVVGPGADRGLVFQDPTLFPWLTVRRNIESGLAASGSLRRRQHEVDDYLRLAGLAEFADAYPHQLSGGMAQRAALARALVNRPRVLLLDEPLGALDQFTRMRMQDELLRLWAARGTTMLLVTHDIDEAIYLADRVAVMSSRPGRIESVLAVDVPRPRLRTDRRFLDLRAGLLEALHLTGG